jgi:DNA polymerase III subunit gamma/tau
LALDTKYRPLHFGDVLGQDVTIKILQEFIRNGTGFHQSYLFCGPWGSGKTTLGRILARALLCGSPVDGEPCDKCQSCRSLLERGSSECFVELDAATKSGKANIVKITDDLIYGTFTGKQRIYLFDEAHRLSKEALDALLVPMESEVPGRDDKQLVCILCTTEPEKVHKTIFSRCALAFHVRLVPPDVIANRLAYICDQEKIEYERKALVTIAGVAECHIRDAIKAIESVITLGPVNEENVRTALRLDVNETILTILALLGHDLDKAMALSDELHQVLSPTSCYERLAQAAMLAYRAHIGAAKVPFWWNVPFVEKLGEHHGEWLVFFANTLTRKAKHPTPWMLSLDLTSLHHACLGKNLVVPNVARPVPTASPNSPSAPVSEPEANGTLTEAPETSGDPVGKIDSPAPDNGGVRRTAYETPTHIYIDTRGVKRRDRQATQDETDSAALEPAQFRGALKKVLAELRADGRERRSERPT